MIKESLLDVALSHRCFATIKISESCQDFCMRSFTSNVFKIDPSDDAQVEKGCTLIQQIYEEVASVLNKVLEEQKAQFIETGTQLEVQRLGASGPCQEEETIDESSSTQLNVSGDNFFNN